MVRDLCGAPGSAHRGDDDSTRVCFRSDHVEPAGGR